MHLQRPDVGNCKAVEAIKQTLPLRRFGTPDEVGAAVVFLMANGWMTGETLHADGGVRLV